jgi:hypothetical protein
MTGDLNALKIAGPMTTAVICGDDAVLMVYTWPCSCEAQGDESESVQIEFCFKHYEVLSGLKAIRESVGLA